jgi:diguanylate cyclase (GGDEF)-like protein
MAVPAARFDDVCARYGELFQALQPRLRGLLLAGSGLRAAGTWGLVPPGTEQLFPAKAWHDTTPAPDALICSAAGNDQDLLLRPLLSDQRQLLGAVALLLQTDAQQAPQAALAALEPALECLRQELAAVELAARDVDALLAASAAQLLPQRDSDVTLEDLLDAGLAGSDSQYALLLVPQCGIQVHRQVATPLSSAVALEVMTLRERLLALPPDLKEPLRIEDHAAHCRILILPLSCCGGRVPAYLAYLAPRESPLGSASQALLQRIGATTVIRRLEATLDRATGLLNRQGMEETLRRDLLGSGSLLLLDIDRLQSVNEVYGFACGDRLIEAVAELVQQLAQGQGAVVARLFGGCFALLLPDRNAAATVPIAEQLLQHVAAVRVEGCSAVTASCGIAESKHLSSRLAQAFVSAELVLGLAKERGRARVEVHVTEDSIIMRRHEEVFAAADLRSALRTGDMLLYGQKIVSLHEADAPVSYELLLRMRDTQGNVHSAKDFIDAAQRYQLLPEIDRYVFDRAIELLTPHRLLVGRRRVGFSINICGGSLCDPAFIDHVVAQVKRVRLPTRLITLEVTEQVAVSDLKWAAQMMQRLRDAGCGVALDDFGTGANSLAYLRTLPVTRIKIDGTFVRDLLTDPRSEAAVRGVTQLAQAFRLDTVAEFVEDALQAEKLRQIGVERGQGHYFGKPGPLELLLQELEACEEAELQELLAPG